MHITKVYKPHWPNCSHKCTNMWVQFILSPANVTCVVHKIKISRQVRQNVKKIWKPREKKPILTNTKSQSKCNYAKNYRQKHIQNVKKIWQPTKIPISNQQKMHKKQFHQNLIPVHIQNVNKIWKPTKNPISNQSEKTQSWWNYAKQHHQNPIHVGINTALSIHHTILCNKRVMTNWQYEYRRTNKKTNSQQVVRWLAIYGQTQWRVNASYKLPGRCIIQTPNKVGNQQQRV